MLRKATWLTVSFACWLACQQNPYVQGKALYDFHCSGCHMEDGSGLVRLIPPLDTNADYFRDQGKLVCLILNGLPLNAMTGQQMPANTTLSEAEMTNLLNYLGHRFTARSQWVKANEIKGLYDACQTPEGPG